MATKRLDAHGESMRDVHVVPHYNSWAVKRDGGVRVSRLANSHEKAIEVGERMAKRDKVSLVIHDIEGNVQNHHYGAASPELVATALPLTPKMIAVIVLQLSPTSLTSRTPKLRHMLAV